MDKKYKISKGYLKEFFGLFGKSKENRTKKINYLIDNDPILKKLDKEIEALNKRATDRIKITDPEWVELLRKNGVDIK
jgi:RNA processing factor Prp31